MNEDGMKPKKLLQGKALTNIFLFSWINTFLKTVFFIKN